MKRLNKLILVFFGGIFIYSCDFSNQNKNKSGYNFETAEEISQEKYDPNLSEKWIKENIPNKHDEFISFDYTLGTKEDFYNFKNILLQPYEKNENKFKYSKMEIVEYKDSVIITFWQNMILEGCYFTGNIEVENDTLKLLFEEICSPYVEYIEGEIVLMHLKYIIKPKAQRNLIIPERRSIN